MNDPLDSESDDRFQLPPPPKKAKRDGDKLKRCWSFVTVTVYDKYETTEVSFLDKEVRLR